MPHVYTLEENYENIADAIREKLGVQTTYKPGEMAAAISSISGGGGNAVWDPVMQGTGTTINDGVATSIPNYAYMVGAAGTGLTSTIAASTAFNRITTATFSEVSSIGNYAMQNWQALQTLNIPKCTQLGTYALFNDTGFTTLNAPLLAMVSGSSFRNCSSLAEFDQPLADIHFSSFFGVYVYDQDVFYGCSNLTKARLKPTMGVGARVFSGCRSLTTLVLLSESLIVLDDTNAFESTPIASGTGYIYVRKSLVDSFKAANKWSTYASQIRAIEDYSDDGTVNGDIIV